MFDDAASQGELQNEAMISCQDHIRLEELSVQQQIPLNDAQREPTELLESDARWPYERLAQRIGGLKEELRKYEQENGGLTAKGRILTVKTELMKSVNAAVPLRGPGSRNRKRHSWRKEETEGNNRQRKVRWAAEWTWASLSLLCRTVFMISDSFRSCK
jgi:hypothetical protein